MILTRAGHRRPLAGLLGGAAMAAALGAGPARALSPVTVEGLGSLSIEELAGIEITSVSKRAQPAAEAPASVYVITGDDIRRSGRTALPEVLRLAPNLQVGRISSSAYAVTARGFNQDSGTANKLQVLIDGRSVYTPLYSGVFWDAEDVMLDDVERIEVISGPAGALWGANAVNGVINVISRHAVDTQGGVMRLDAGTTDQSGSARYGGRLGELGYFRLYGMTAFHGPSRTSLGAKAEDAWDKTQAGFRADLGPSGDSLTLQGDVYAGETRTVAAVRSKGVIQGGDLLGRWTRNLSGGGVLEVQASADATRRTVSSGIRDTLRTVDLEAQYTVSVGGRHDLVVGAGYKASRDAFAGGPGTAFLSPDRRSMHIANLFVQDELALTDRLTLTLAGKVEDNTYTGVEYLPSARIAWRAAPTTLVWAAASRSVRTPSRFDRDLVNPGLIAGGPNFVSERLTAYELGYRAQAFGRTSLSVSGFYHVYDDLRSAEPAGAAPFPLEIRNGQRGRTYGVEAWGAYAVTGWWRLTAGLSTLHKDLELKPGVRDLLGVGFAGADPSWQASLRSRMNLGEAVELDLGVRAVDDLPDPAVPAYLEADARLAWRVTDTAELWVQGFNLAADRHLEFVNRSLPRREFERTLQLGARVRF
jgi:iron complex outermembrane receptor protein